MVTVFRTKLPERAHDGPAVTLGLGREFLRRPYHVEQSGWEEAKLQAVRRGSMKTVSKVAGGAAWFNENRCFPLGL